MRTVFAVGLLVLASVSQGQVPVPARGKSASYDSAGIHIWDYRALPATDPVYILKEPFVSFRGDPRQGSDVLGTSMIARLRDGRIAAALSFTSGPVRMVPVPPDSTRGRLDSAPPVARPIPTGAASLFREIHLYDSTGAFIRRMGSSGSGPDQFPAAFTALAELTDGNLFVATNSPGWAVYTTTGLLDNSVSRTSGAGVPIGVFGDGSALVVRPHLPPESANDPVVEGRRFVLDSTEYFRVSNDGKRSTRLPFITHRPWTGVTAAERTAAVARVAAGGAPPTASPYIPWPINAPSMVVTGHNIIWAFDFVNWDLRVMDEQGALRGVTRPPIPGRVSRARLGTPFPRDSLYTLPVLVDDTGRLWMDTGFNPVPVLNQFDPRSWVVFDTDGHLLASVMMPGGFRPLSVSGGVLLGTYRPSAFAGTSIVGYRYAFQTR